MSLEDSISGTVRLSGRLSGCPPGIDATRTLLVLVHGLGGSSESGYMLQMAGAASSLGMGCLRLNLRGADHEGRDFYHGGLTDDLHAAVSNPPLSGFERIVCLGFSLGGHVVLRFGTEVEEPRVAALAGVCSPLDLGVGARAIDRAALGIYRFYLLRGLRTMHRRLSGLGRLPGDPETAQRARTLRQWDSATVVPRFGFRDVDDYYRRASVGSEIRNLRRPALMLLTEDDPMVPAAAIRGLVEPETPSELTIRWFRRGGHLALPREIDLGIDGPKDWRTQALLWLLAMGEKRFGG